MGRSIVLMAAATAAFPPPGARAEVPCESTAECEEKLRPGSVCRARRRRRSDADADADAPTENEQKYCSNPFASGCLRRILGEEKFPKLRVCNSDDDGGGGSDASMCVPPSIADYTEIRIGPSNWESPMFLAWMMQVLLSEVVGVPSTIETSSVEQGAGGPLSFYDEENAFSYPKVYYNFGGLQKANSLPDGDCTLSKGEPCCHLLPEVWHVDQEWGVEERDLERDGCGMVGKVGWHVPSFVAKADPSLGMHWGLSGEKNREKLARTFKRPTTWGHYCRELSPTNCTVAEATGANTTQHMATGNVSGVLGDEEERANGLESDGQEPAATRPPRDENEASLYYHAEAYKGHFRATDENNCSLPGNANTCTGHIIDYPCGWVAYTEGQIYWNDIALDSAVPGKPERYNYGEILQIMAASEATRSPAMFVWWYPEWNLDRYEMVSVSLPQPTRECLDHRTALGGGARCEANLTTLRGEAKGGCDHSTQDLQKIFASSLRGDTFAAMNEADRSPAYNLLRNFRVSDIDMREIMRSWAEREVDTYGFDPREAVCTWLADNLNGGQHLNRTFVPPGFPRQVAESSYDVPLVIAAMVLACIAVAVILAQAAACNWYRTEQAIQYAQLKFLRLLSAGYFLVAVGAALHTTEPTKGTCVSRQWLIVLGYTLGLVPLLIKIAAINHIMQKANKMKRVVIPQGQLRLYVGLGVAVITVFLSIWTVFDPSTREEERVLLPPREDGIVEVRVGCASSSGAWKAAAFGWEALYVLVAAVLAFASRSVRQDFNESRTLGNMAYSHSLFLLLRMLAHYVLPSSGVDPRDVAAATGLLLSIDSMMSPSLYFVPRFLVIRQKSIRATSRSSFTPVVPRSIDLQRSPPPTLSKQASDGMLRILGVGGTQAEETEESELKIPTRLSAIEEDRGEAPVGEVSGSTRNMRLWNLTTTDVDEGFRDEFCEESEEGDNSVTWGDETSDCGLGSTRRLPLGLDESAAVRDDTLDEFEDEQRCLACGVVSARSKSCRRRRATFAASSVRSILREESKYELSEASNPGQVSSFDATGHKTGTD